MEALQVLTIGDDWLYETFGIDKPKNYDELKKEIEEQSTQNRLGAIEQEDDNLDERTDKTPITHQKSNKKEKKRTFKDWFMRFFGFAPKKNGAESDW